jgi:hypothetical protein
MAHNIVLFTNIVFGTVSFHEWVNYLASSIQHRLCKTLRITDALGTGSPVEISHLCNNSACRAHTHGALESLRQNVIRSKCANKKVCRKKCHDINLRVRCLSYGLSIRASQQDALFAGRRSGLPPVTTISIGTQGVVKSCIATSWEGTRAGGEARGATGSSKCHFGDFERVVAKLTKAFRSCLRASRS